MSEGSHETQTRIAKLEQEILELKRTLSRLFTVLDISTTKEPLLRLLISLDATGSQEAEVYDLVAEVDASLSRHQPTMDHLAFCDRLCKIFPGHEPQHLAEAVVGRLAEDGGWDRVYQHLRRSGMVLRDVPGPRRL
jgi:hypothetical protein